MQPRAWLAHLASLNRRTNSRTSVYYPVSYRLLGSHQSQFSLSKDISLSGLCFVTETRLHPGVVIHIELQIPDRERPIHALARVVWSEPLVRAELPRSARLHETGSCVLDISPEDQAALAEMGNHTDE
jgi:hypothetical protein